MLQIHVHLELGLIQSRIPLGITLHKLGAAIHQKVQRAHPRNTLPILVIAPSLRPLQKTLVEYPIRFSTHPLLSPMQKLQVSMPCVSKQRPTIIHNKLQDSGNGATPREYNILDILRLGQLRLAQDRLIVRVKGCHLLDFHHQWPPVSHDSGSGPTVVRHTERYHTYVVNQTRHGLLRVICTGILHYISRGLCV